MFSSRTRNPSKMIKTKRNNSAKDLQNKNNNLDIATDVIMNIDQHPHIESEEEPTKQCVQHDTTCLPCKNGHFPTVVHKCAVCNKSVHLFGCSVRNVRSKEGYGESRICLSCAEQAKENDVENHWQRKYKTSNHYRSANSYLVSQPGFEHLNLNKKGTEKPIIFLKNGNSFHNKP